MFRDDVRADSSGMDSEVCTATLAAQIQSNASKPIMCRMAVIARQCTFFRNCLELKQEVFQKVQSHND